MNMKLDPEEFYADTEVPVRKRKYRAMWDILRERATHPARGYDSEHDKEHGYGHLILLALDRLNRAYASQGLDSKAQAFAREQLVKAAALIIAAIDVIDAAELE